MAAHYRVASADAKLGLPEVKLGLLPGRGRHPATAAPGRRRAGDRDDRGRRAGTRRRSGGNPAVDRVVAGDPLAEAVELAASAKSEAPHPRARDLPLVEPRLAALCEAARARLRRQRLRAAGPTARGGGDRGGGAYRSTRASTIERRAFVELMETPESKGLRHAFFAERAAGKVDGITPSTPVRPLEQAAVIGAGTMGAGITVALLDAGIPVWLARGRPGGAGPRPGAHRRHLRGAGEEGQAHRRASGTGASALLRPTLSYDAIGRADLVIEAVFESLRGQARRVHRARPGHEAGRHPRHQHLDARRERDRRLHPAPRRRARPALLQSGERDAAAGGGARPGDVARGPGDGARARPRRCARWRWSRACATASSATGCSTPTSGRPGGWSRKARRPEQVDRAIEAFGFAMGPFRVGDLVGHDVSQAIRQRRRAERPGYRDSTLPDKLCRLGRLGQKTGRRLVRLSRRAAPRRSLRRRWRQLVEAAPRGDRVVSRRGSRTARSWTVWSMPW